MNTRVSMSVMTHLLDILTEILSWLPTKHLLRFKCVSKTWYNLINNPSFIRLHCSRSKTSLIMMILEYPFEDGLDAPSLPFYNLSYEPVKGVQITRYIHHYKALNNVYGSIVGSCNGLLCLQGTFSSHYLYSLYNPATRAYKCITPLSFTDSTTSKYQPVALLSSNDRRFIAFGYDSVSDDYKILMLTKYAASHQLVTNFYSLKTDTWAIIQNPPWNWAVLCWSSDAICVNSSLHWLPRNQPEEIKCFDLVTRRYYEKPVPETIASLSPMLGVVRGRLCVVTRVLDIWVLEESWTRVFHNLSRIYAVINTWGANLSCVCIEHGSNDILVVISNAAKNAMCSYMYLCDQRSGKTRVIATPCCVDGVALHSPVQPWVESLVPLESKQQQARTQKRGQVDDEEEDIRNDARLSRRLRRNW